MFKNKNNYNSGLSIKTINIWLIAVVFLTFILVIISTFAVSSEYKKLLTASDNYVEAQKVASELNSGSDYLTEQVRMYAMTGDKNYLDAYFADGSKSRKEALNNIMTFNKDSIDASTVETIVNNSTTLSNTELTSMKLISLGNGYDISTLPQDIKDFQLPSNYTSLGNSDMINTGRSLVFDNDYTTTKTNISTVINKYASSMTDKLKVAQGDSRADFKTLLFQQKVYVCVLCIIDIIFFIIFIFMVIKPLQIFNERINKNQTFEVKGAQEFRRFAETYNRMFDRSQKNKELLQYRAELDPLTDLLSKNVFDILTVLLRRKQCPIALLLVDIDKFADINEKFGTTAGDKSLQKVANMLESNFRDNDYIFRISDDKFAVVMVDIKSDAKSVIRRKINVLNNRLVDSEDKIPSMSVSVGVVISDNGYSDAMYKEADIALDKSISNGRCQCNFYED